MTIIKINALTVPAEQGDAMAGRFASRAGSVDGFDGFEGFELLRPNDGRETWLVVTRWADEESYSAWRRSESFAAGHKGAGGPPSGGDHGSPGGDRPQGGPPSEVWSFDVSVFSGG